MSYTGDEIQDWNEQSLVDCTFEEVVEIINSSMEDNQDSNELHLIVCRDKWVINTHKFSLPSYFIIRKNGSENGENDQGWIFLFWKNTKSFPSLHKNMIFGREGKEFFRRLINGRIFLKFFPLGVNFQLGPPSHPTSHHGDKNKRGNLPSRSLPESPP